VRKFTLALWLVSLGCGGNYKWSTTEPSSEIEAILLSETTRFAKLHVVNVRGEITDKLSPAQAAGPTPVGWYANGIAYYYRPMIVKFIVIEAEPGKLAATDVASHEVCHVKNPVHDMPHWVCMSKFASPTYPAPASGLTSAVSCF
jgi:hypothetical protein